MKLENQVCSLELAKKLKELRVEQSAYFTWYVNGDKGHLMHNPEGFRGFESKSFDAFTVAELGEMLPEEIEVNEVSYWVGINRGLGQSWQVFYRKNGTDFTRYLQNAETEADTRAKMLIYLIANKLISL